MRPLPRPALSPVLAAAVLAAAVLAAAVLLVAPPGTAHAAPGVERAAPADDARPEPYVVTLAPDADPERVMRETGVVSARFVYRDAIRGFAADLDGEQLAALRAHPAVTGVEADSGVVGAPVEQGPGGGWATALR